MPTITKSIVINAPVEKVFAYVDEPTTALEYWPSMVDIRNVKDIGGGLRTFDWTYKMAGMKFDGSSEEVERVVNERAVTLSKGGIESKITWIFTPVQGGTATELMIRTEYTVPMPVLGRLAEGLIHKQNEHETDTLLANLKIRMEAPETVK